jgi:integrase
MAEQLPGSFGALVLDYLASPEFKATRPNTQKAYRQVLEPLAALHGPKPVALLERRHIKAWFNARAETPAAANMIVSVMRMLLNYAVENELRPDNPARRIKLFKGGEQRAWTDEACAAFEARWPPGSMQRRAYLLARFTGQRCGDIAAITWAHRKEGAIRVVQQKTGTPLWIPELRELAADLALGGAHMSLLTKSDDSAFDANGLGQWFADAIEEAGLPDACVMHGLRKTSISQSSGTQNRLGTMCGRGARRRWRSTASRSTIVALAGFAIGPGLALELGACRPVRLVLGHPCGLLPERPQMQVP